MKDIKYYSRKFLNKKTGIAAIQCDADISNYSMYSSVSISDCNRQITLDFTAYNAKEFDVKLAKLGLIMSELFELEQFLLDHKCEWLEEMKKQELKKAAYEKKQKKDIDNYLQTVAE
jgi:hypothetical protein